MQLSTIFRRTKPLCRLSDPAEPHNLCRRYDPPLSVCFTCNGQHLEDKRYYYYCASCDLEFHRGCHLFPPKIRHPFHLLHPLTLTLLYPDFQISEIPIGWTDGSDSDISVPDNIDNFGSYEHHIVKCSYCRKNIRPEKKNDAYYHCSTCNFSIHDGCALIRPPLTIENFKSHDHTLTLFPRRVPLPCDACGFTLDVLMNHVYTCLLCNYMVHRSCIYLPRVIKITRHPHRLSYTSSIVPSRELFCGVCRKFVDVNYGSYLCNKGCDYALHSKCATNKKVWDGIDLEGVAEEEEEILEPFLRIDEETIQHFSHDHHHLKLCQDGGSHENKFCEACTLSMTVSDSFYGCNKCEFVLHEECASLPRRKHHPVHRHPLTLFHPYSSDPNNYKYLYYRDGFFKCDGCNRDCCGFMYKCSDENCEFQIDTRCASLPDPTIHGCHPSDHPLFFNLTRGTCMGEKTKLCYISTTSLECIKCDDSFLCLHCATFPSVAHYKHDKHPLTLCYGEEETTDLNYWCEICESKVDATKWFYTCNSCSVTLHVTCLLGKEFHYMMPNHIVNIYCEDIEIGCNNGNTRPVCNSCRRRCMYNLVFKFGNSNFCSWSCYTG